MQILLLYNRKLAFCKLINWQSNGINGNFDVYRFIFNIPSTMQHIFGHKQWTPTRNIHLALGPLETWAIWIWSKAFNHMLISSLVDQLE